MRTIADEERCARLARRHGLAPEHRFADVNGVAQAIVALHASDPASVFLAARARLAAPSVAAIEAATYAALVARGEATTAELGEDVPALWTRTPVAQDKPYAASPAVSTRIMFLLAAEGRIVRGRPGGTWTSSLYRWAPAASWLGAPERARPVSRSPAPARR